MSLAWLKGAVPAGPLAALLAGGLAGALFLFQGARIDGLQEAVARKENELAARDAAIAELRSEPPWLNAVLEGFSHDVTDIAALRKAVRHELKAAMRDPAFAAWGASELPSRLRHGAGVPGGGLLGGSRAAGDTPCAAPGAGAGGARP